MTPEQKLKKGLTALRLEVDASIVDALEKLIQQAKEEWEQSAINRYLRNTD